MENRTENKELIIFNHNCDICDKYPHKDKENRHPVIYNPTGETIFICETCLSFIKDHEECSSFKVIKK
jgi:hypothetical protein